MKKKILLSSILTIALCLSLIAGSTFALFTSESKVNIAVTSGKVEMLANVTNLETWSLEDDKSLAGRTDGTFTQGGNVLFNDSVLSINKIIPGDKVSFLVTGTNNSNVTIMYRTVIKCLSGETLMDGMKVTIDGESYFGLNSYVTSWNTLTEGSDMKDLQVSVELPFESGNIYQDLNAELLVIVEAIQGNASVKDEKEVVLVNFWDGSSDEEGLLDNTDDVNKEVIIETAEELSAFRDNVNNGITYKGYTVKLISDIDLNGVNWTPIGPNADAKNKFQGTFDGNNNTIYNLAVNQGAAYHAAGLFGALNGTVKNLVIENAEVSSISLGSATDNGTAVVAGSIYRNGLIDNVTVKNSKVYGNRYVAAISGYVYGSITNCTVTGCEIVAEMDNLTGKYDNGDKVGAIAGYMAGEKTYVLCGNKVYNSTLVAERDVAGIVGVASNLKEFENNTVQDVTIKYHSVRSYKTASEIVSERTVIDIPLSNTFNNVEIILDAKTLENVKDALDLGLDVNLLQDVSGAANDSNGYGATGVYVNGTLFNGNGNTFSVSNANGTWDSAVSTNGGTIKNLNIEGAFRGIFTGGLKSDLYIDNVYVDKVCYTFNADGTDADTYSLIVTNSTFNGWTSYSNIFKEVSFTNCNFGKGTGGYTYAYMRPYNDSLFTNCVFEENYAFDSSRATSTFVNCYVGTTLITQENVTTLLGSSADKIVVNNK